jgi:hypothetical protein
MMNLADSLKEQMGTMMQQSKGDRLASNKISDQVLAAAVQRQARNLEMPKKAPLPSDSQRNLQQEDKRTNQYKRERSGSNNAKRPPIPMQERENHSFNKLATVTIDHSYRDEAPSTTPSIIAEMHY